MKKRLLLAIGVVVVFVSCGALWTVAANKQTSKQAVEEYDEDLYGPEEPIVWTKPVKGVIFEHKVHTMDVGLDCESCHDHTFEMYAGAAEEEDDFTMEAMAAPNHKYCGNCHYEGGFGYSVMKRCTSCHIGVKGVERLMGEDENGEH